MPISDMIKSHDICIQQTDMEFDAFVLHECIYDVHSNIPDLPYFLLYKVQFFSFRNAPQNHNASYTLVVLYINK